MSATHSIATAPRLRRALAAVVVAGTGLSVGACAQLGSTSPQLSALQAAAAKPATDSRTELQKATEYWGKAYAEDPRDAQNALNYARNLKALGEKRQALAVMQQAVVFHGSNRAIIGEYGRLALEFDQVSVAQKLLEQADDPTNPDWKVISARGTVLAKQNLFRDAIPFYEKALKLAPDEASLLNNLALAHAMDGNADKAEEILKRAAVAKGNNEARISQNLALVLGLQGKYDEATLTGANTLSADKAAENSAYMRRLVKIEPKPLPKVAAKAPEKAPESKAAEKAVDKKTADKKPPLKGAAGDDVAADTSAGWATQVAAVKKTR